MMNSSHLILSPVQYDIQVIVYGVKHRCIYDVVVPRYIGSSISRGRRRIEMMLLLRRSL